MTSLYGSVLSTPSVGSTSMPSKPSTTLCPLYGPLSSLWPTVLSTALCLLYASAPLYPLYGLLAPLRPSVALYGPLSSLRPSISFTTLCPLPSVLSTALISSTTLSLYGPLSPLRPSTRSTVLCPIYCTALCPLYSHLSPLPSFPSVPSWHFYGPMPPQLPSALSTSLYPSTVFYSLPMARYPLYGPLYSLRPSVLSTALGHLYGSLSPLWTSVPSTRHIISHCFANWCCCFAVSLSKFHQNEPFREIAKQAQRLLSN